MNKITIKAICGEVSNDNEDTIPRILGGEAQYHGENFSDYLDEYYGSVHEKVSGGGMNFSYENDELYVSTTYNVLTPLTDEEKEKLGEYTQGQWSDGIGEGFEQEPALSHYVYGDIYVSPWYVGQTLEIIEHE